ncbi:MAG: hypothetical protein JNK87_01245 [Bryobacterales bacterium]|nr:hypothetical protein [Bryobacterales bacterium]
MLPLLAVLLAASLAPAQTALYRLQSASTPRPSQVTTFTLSVGPQDHNLRWISLTATKQNADRYTLWILSAGEPTPANVQRYLFQDSRLPRPREYRHALTHAAILPTHGLWEQLQLPLLHLPPVLHYLGHDYHRDRIQPLASLTPPTGIETIDLRPDLLIGPASNTRQKDETRRYDGSDYELIPLTAADYRLMRDVGITCVKADATQWQWPDELGLYFWGPIAALPFPEALYRSNYLGPALFLDEPAVGTRDHVVRPRLAKDPAYREALSPQLMLEAFAAHFQHTLDDGAPWALHKALRARTDIDPGDMRFPQQNLYTWETMVSTAAWQLSRQPSVPEAFVFEPPGRIGTRRTLPEMNMTYGVHLPPDDPKALTSILFGFLRGAARATSKQWGISIYGAVDRSDAPFWLTHAYDLGATRFFFWDNYQLACVPFGEVLAHARHLREHARTHPRPTLDALRNAATTALLLPPGYDLGHVQTGKGNLWGIHELNLERTNGRGVTHRAVMSLFFSEIERLFKSGEPFDLLWDLPNLPPTGYRNVIRVREDATVEGAPAAKPPAALEGAPPRLTLTLSPQATPKDLQITAKARVDETSNKVFYTFGTDSDGVYRNALVAWELYGPESPDQLLLIPDQLKPRAILDNTGGTVEVTFSLTRPGRYRLRAATVDTAGRATVVWHPLTVSSASNGQLALQQN